MRKTLFFALIIYFLLVFGSARAAAVKVRPAGLKIEAVCGILSAEKITVENPGANVALFEVYADDFSDWVKARPESFMLEGGAKKEVALEVKAKEQGAFSTMLSVVAKPLSDRQFQANSGVKIPLEIRVAAGGASMFLASLYPWRLPIYLLSGSLILLLILAMLKLKQRYNYGKNR